jgi:hypothetical protein
MLKPNEQQARLLRSHHRRHGKNQYPDHAVFAQSIHQATHSMSQSYLFVFGFRAHDGCSYSQDSHTVSSFRAIGLVCGPFLRRREETSEMKDGWLAGWLPLLLLLHSRLLLPLPLEKVDETVISRSQPAVLED